jgi:hypothetical protein
MNTAQLTPRAQAVIAASDEYTDPIFRTPSVQPAERPRSLLRPVGSRPTVCYCPPDKCQAPKGFRGPCNRAVDVHALLNAADEQKQARAKQPSRTASA